MKNLVFLIPTMDEESSIGLLLDKINSVKDSLSKKNKVIVYDKSSDRTPDIAKEKGAKVIKQRSKGKGAAVIEAVHSLDDNDLIIMLDADLTYEVDDAKKLLGYWEPGVIVNGIRRFKGPGAMTLFNTIGNILINMYASVLFQTLFQDILSGYKIFQVKDFKKLNIKSKNFEIETEIALSSVKAGIEFREVPVSYYKREGETKLNPVRDGFRIIRRITFDGINSILNR